ncbi:hypothetical protein L1887_23902 [Cichorium endivia]|nr:hypothetical protein L1887_23902 [Cichorium endivia]
MAASTIPVYFRYTFANSEECRSMEPIKLELILHSAQGLNNVKKMGTMDPYAVIWIAGNSSDSKVKTNTAKNGGSNPVWDALFEFNIEQDATMQENLVLVCEIKHSGTVVDRNIGQVQVPLKHLLSEDASGEKVSYPVMTPSGGVEGMILISYKVKNLLEGSNSDSSSPADEEASDTSSPAKDEASDPLPKDPHQTNNRKNRLIKNVLHVSSVMANSLTIASSVFTLSAGGGSDD